MKEYPVGNEIAELFENHYAAKNLRDTAIKLPFGYKKAFRASQAMEKYYKEAWEKIGHLYPELKKYDLQYRRNFHTVSARANEEKSMETT